MSKPMKTVTINGHEDDSRTLESVKSQPPKTGNKHVHSSSGLNIINEDHIISSKAPTDISKTLFAPGGVPKLKVVSKAESSPMVAATFVTPVAKPKPVVVVKAGYSNAEIENMPYIRKEESDGYDSDTGQKKHERCYLCKWYIEKGNYFLTLDTCGHRIHKKCLEVWFLRNRDCPVCKEQLTKEQREKQDYKVYNGESDY